MVWGIETMVPNKCVGPPDDGFIVSSRAFARLEGWKSDDAR